MSNGRDASGGELKDGFDPDRELCLEYVVSAAEVLRYEDVADEPVEPGMVDLARRALANLTDEERAVIELRLIEGKTDLQIINATGFHEEKVKQLGRSGMFGLIRQLPPAKAG